MSAHRRIRMACLPPGTGHMKPLHSTVTKCRGLHMEGIKTSEELRLHYPGHKPDLHSGRFFPEVL